jgi:serine protease AprX
MEIRSSAALPKATAPVAPSSASPAAPAASSAPPHDEVVIQNVLTAGTQVRIPESIDDVSTYGRKIPDGSKRLDVLQELLHLDKVHDMGITGKGVTVAVIDTGIYPHEDYKDRIIGWQDMVNGRPTPYDDNGHGTHCSGLVAGNGHMAGGHFQGAAPEANLVGVKVLSGEGGGAMSDVIRGIEWAIENKERYNIRVLSMSLGAPAMQKEKYDLVAKAVAKAYDAGIVPVVAAGNSGPFLETIGSPAISSKAFTVGAYDDKNTPDMADDTMAFFSSRGPTTADRTIKPDIASPGVNLVSTRSPGSAIDHENIPRYGDDYILLSGTSMATPVMAGVAADIIQANPNLTPAQVISLVRSTALPIANTTQLAQGAGLVNPVAAVTQALQMRQGTELGQATAAPQHVVDFAAV